MSRPQAGERSDRAGAMTLVDAKSSEGVLTGGPLCPSAPPEAPNWRYLREALGEALSGGLAELCQRRPHDPIEFLAQWLRQHARTLEIQHEEALLGLKLKLQQEGENMTKGRQDLLRRERQQLQQEERRRQKIFLQQASGVSKDDDFDTTFASEPRNQGAPQSIPEEDDLSNLDLDDAVTSSASNSATTGHEVNLETPGHDDLLYTIQETAETDSQGQLDE